MAADALLKLDGLPTSFKIIIGQNIDTKIFGSLQIIIWNSLCHLRQVHTEYRPLKIKSLTSLNQIQNGYTIQNCPSLLNLIIFHCLLLLNDQFYNPFSHIVARTRIKLAKWAVKPNHYLALGFTTHLTNSMGIKVLMKLAKWVVSPNC